MRKFLKNNKDNIIYYFLVLLFFVFLYFIIDKIYLTDSELYYQFMQEQIQKDKK